MVGIFTGLGSGLERGSGSVLGSAGLLGSATLGRSGEQVFLNATTGNLVINQQDEFLVGLGSDVSISRTYNSLGNLSDDSGVDNWMQSTQRRIRNYNSSTVERVGADGAVITYALQSIAGESAYFATDGGGAYDKLTYNAATEEWTWTDGDSRITETYAKSGSEWLITKQTDSDGNQLTWERFDNNRLYRITTQDGSYVRYGWDESYTHINEVVTGYTDLTSSSATTLTRTRYTYDGENRLSTVTVDLSPGDNTTADGKTYTTTYTYVSTLSKLVSSISQSDGSQITIRYDANNRVDQIVQTVASQVTRTTNISYSVTATANTTTISDSTFGEQVVLVSDALGQLTEIRMPPAANNEPRQIVEFQYNGTGDVLSVTTKSGTQTTGVTTYTYDDPSNPSTSDYGLAHTITDRENNVTTRKYGARNELLTETTTSSDSGSAAAPHTVRYAYDSENHLKYAVSVEGLVTAYDYDLPGNLTATIAFPNQSIDLSTLSADPAQWLGQLETWVNNADKTSIERVENTYDGRGGLLTSTSYSATTAAGLGAGSDTSVTTNYVYDQSGKLRSRNVQGRNADTFVYDGMGRLVSSVDVNGGTTSWVFDDARTRTLVTLASGLIQTSTYNKAGELVSFAESALPNLAPDVTSTAQWSQTNVTASADTIGLDPAVKLTVTAAGSEGVVVCDDAVAAGDTYTVEMTLQAAGPKNYAHVGIYGSSYGWGQPADTVAVIISGPGTLTRTAGGLWQVSGLSSTQATRVRLVRSFAGAQTAQGYLFISDTSGAASPGDAVKVALPLVTVAPAAQIAAVTGTATSGYDQLGRLRWQVDATGRKSYFLYDKVGRKVADVSSLGDIIEYRYDSDDRLTTTISYNTRLTSVQLAALGNETTAAKITDFRPAQSGSDVWNWYVYDREGRLLQTINAWGHTTVNTYDGEGRLVREASYYNNIGTAAVEGFKTTPPAGIVLPWPQSDPQDEVTRMFYDKDGRLIGTLNGEGFVTRIFYDRAGRKTAERAYLNNTTADRVSSTFDQIVAGVAAHADDRQTRYVYDGRGQLRFVVDAKLQVTERRYNNAGEAATTIVYANALSSGTTDFRYSNLKTLVGTAGFASADDRWSWSVHDSAGRVVQTINGGGLTSVYSYDSIGRLIKTVEYANNVATAAIEGFKTAPPTGITYPSPIEDPKNRITRNYYDAAGVLRFTVDPEGYVSRRTEDAEGRLIQTTRFAAPISVTDSTTTATVHALATGERLDTYLSYDGAGRVNASYDGEGIIRRYEYNANGTLAFDIVAWGTPDESRTYFVYDKAGRKIEEHRAYGTPDVSVTRFEYDALGNVTKIIDPNNQATSQTFDHLGRVLTRTDALTGVTRFEYDAFGNVVKTTDARNHASYSYYDSLGRLTATRDAEDYVTETTYTAFGEVWKVVRRYNKANNPAAVGVRPTFTIDAKDAVTSFEYDRLGRLTKSIDAELYYEQYTLDAFGNRVEVRNKLGGIIKNSFDRRGLLLTEELPMQSIDAVGTVLAITVTNRFEYDARGNRTKMVEANGLVEQRTTSYEYDRVDRLIAKGNDAVTVLSQSDHLTESTVTPTEHYKYDARGNLIEVTDALNARTVSYYDDLNRKIAEVRQTSAAGTGTLTTWTYDAAGNRLTERVYAEAVSVPALAEDPNLRPNLPDWTRYNLNFAAAGQLLGADAYRLTATAAGASAATVTWVAMAAGETLTFTLTLQASGPIDYHLVGLAGATSGWGLAADSTARIVSGPGELVAGGGGGAALHLIRGLSNSEPTRIQITRHFAMAETATAYVFLKTANGGEVVGGEQVILADPEIYKGPIASYGAQPPQPTGDYRQTSFSYDALNRLKETKIAGVRYGTWNGSTGVSVTSNGEVASTIDYDANGNVIVTTDANGGKIHSWYDKVGRKTVQVDALNYVTRSTYDSEGNVLSETRYATPLTGPPSVGPEPAMPASHADDRITEFTYDRNGRRETETRRGVAAWTVNPNNGALTAASTDSVIRYTYNGLGQVISKHEATNDAVNYDYDWTGRLIKESRAAYTGSAGGSVTPTVCYSYNGLNNLSRTRQGGATELAGDRITTYAYAAGSGRLLSMTDAASGVHNYSYDAAGNLLRDSYTRAKANGATVTEGILYGRDVLGRITSQAIGTYSNGSWVKGDIQATEYNASGDVARRGINGLWQESFTYNNRGLVEKTNSGDGVWRFFVYDKNGNQLMAIESEGADVSARTLGQTLGDIQPGGVPAGSTFVDGFNVAITVFDKRNQATQTVLPHRELADGAERTAIVTSQAYNAFGDVASQTDALNHMTTFSYNTMGRLIQRVMPQISIQSETGAESTATPTEKYYYDLAGRLVAFADANRVQAPDNAFSWSRNLLAGTGYGGGEALVAKEFHPDPGTVETHYDVFGDARLIRNERNLYESRTYDAMGRVATIVRRTGLQEAFTYDLLGQRLKRTLLDASNYELGTETTDYDRQGRVVSSVDLGGDRTDYAYAWDVSVSTALGASGGWTKTTTAWHQLGSALWKVRSETTDVRGLVTAETDFGEHSISYTYDRAGRLTQKQGVNGGVVTTLAYTYFNTGLTATVADTTSGMTANSITSTFAYDKMGRRIAEKYAGTAYRSTSDTNYTSLTAMTGTVLQDATISYDALGRIRTVTNKNASGVTDFSLIQTYDAAGNIRRTYASYPDLYGTGSNYSDKWFTYDSMNRMLIADGTLSGTVVAGASGAAHTYDAAGNRKTATRSSGTERYEYDPDNQLTEVYKGYNTLVAHTSRDIRGRVTANVEYSGTKVASHRWNITYNARGQVDGERSYQWIDGADDIDSTITNSYDDYGNLTNTFSQNAGISDTSQQWHYAWWDGAAVSYSRYDRDYYGSNTLYRTDQYYDGLGRLQRAMIADGKPRAVHFGLNSDGQVVTRWQSDMSSNDPTDIHRFVSGVQVGEYTNDAREDLRNYDYQALILEKTKSETGSGRFWHGRTTAVAGGEFGTSGYDPINGITAGTTQSSRSRYTVAAGDTLQGIARTLWGDSSLWYKLADANGLSADAALTAGQSLSIPLSGPSNRNNADMFRPYDASSAVGDLNPTSVKPPKGNKCGAFGQVLLVAIAVAVTIVSYGALTGPTTTALGAIAAGAASGAAGSVVSQGVGIATGIQQGGFSFKQVALSALAGGIGSGVGQVLGRGAMFGSQFAGDAIRGAVGNALTQGIGVATGLQPKFDWAGVAAAGIGAGAGNAFARSVLGANPNNFGKSAGGYANMAATSMAGAVANAATRSLINGSDFGDNVMAALPDAIGQTVGNALADGATKLAAQATRSRGGNVAPVSGQTQAAAGTGVGVGSQPTTGAGGGQVGTEQTDPGEIVVTGTRQTNWTPAQRAAYAAAQEARWAAEEAESERYRPVQMREPSSLAQLGEWKQDIAASRLKDPTIYANDPDIDAGFAYWEQELARRDGIADAQLAQDARDFGSIYYETAATVIAPIGLLDTGYRAATGQLTAAEIAVALVTMNKGRVAGAAERGGIRIATEGSGVAGTGISPLLGQIRGAGGTLPVSRGQFGVQDIAGASRAGGNEVAFFRDRATGQLYLRELGPQMGTIPKNSRLILHTQPGSMPLSVQPSAADRAALSALGQRSSVIVNYDGTYAIRFRPNNAGDGQIRWIGN